MELACRKDGYAAQQDYLNCQPSTTLLHFVFKTVKRLS